MSAWRTSGWFATAWRTGAWYESGGSTPTATVPDVVGDAEAVAIAAIEAVNLVASVAYAPSGSVAAGDVISQYPAAGAVVDEGTSVTIVVSTGVATGGTASRKLRRLFRVFFRR